MSREAGSGSAGKKFFLSAILIVAFAFYTVSARKSGAGNFYVQPITELPLSIDSPTNPSPVPVLTPTPTPGKSTPAPAKPAPAPAPNPTPIPAPKPKGLYTDGAYTGSSADAYYGYMQVKAIISGGKITDVVFLDYPHDRSTSMMINKQASAYLRQEAIQAQSAKVNIISGATDSSLAFRQSLAFALNQAKN